MYIFSKLPCQADHCVIIAVYFTLPSNEYQHMQYSCNNALEKLLFPGLHCWHTVDALVIYTLYVCTYLQCVTTLIA